MNQTCLNMHDPGPPKYDFPNFEYIYMYVSDQGILDQ